VGRNDIDSSKNSGGHGDSTMNAAGNLMNAKHGHGGNNKFGNRKNNHTVGFYEGYLRNLNRGGEIGYYVINRFGIIGYASSRKEEVLLRLQHRYTSSVKKVDKVEVERRCRIMRRLINLAFILLIED